MKLLLLLLCLLLCGCGKEAPDLETTVPATAAATVPETEPVSMYDPGNPLEAKYDGTLKVYPLTMRKVRGIRAMQDGMLVFSGYGSTTLTVLKGEHLTITASITLDHELDARDSSLRLGDGTISYFDPGKHTVVVLNEDLKEIRHTLVVDTILGSPILSADGNTLFYCTYDAIRAWDLETGIHRTVKKLSYEEQELTGLHLNDTVLQCRIRDGGSIQTLFLSAQTGQLLAQQDGEVSLSVQDQRYYASLPVGYTRELLFGELSGEPRILYPADLNAETYFLPEDHAAVSIFDLDTEVRLAYYDLSSGICRAELPLDALQHPKSVVNGSGDSVYLLAYDPENDCDTIYRWDVPEATDEAGTVYTENYHSDPTVGLAQCQTYAAELSVKYGMDIRIGEDALAVQPWDYTFQAEDRPRILMQELQLLDRRLSLFPEGMLEKSRSHFSSVKLCLVRQITGTAASGSLNTATGVQFLDGTDAYAVITAGTYSQQALYHELFHIMETHILNESAALDQWNDLNPDGFEYTYGSDPAEDFSMYLSGDSRAFADAYSMSLPKEDRARILENAILPGNDAMFESEIMQAKLTALCQGIRQAYGLRKSEETFLWEQYLEVP